MPIALLCPGCKTRLTVGDDRSGTTFTCPRCSTAISVPMTAPLPTPAPRPAPPPAPLPPPPPRRAPAPPPPVERDDSDFDSGDAVSNDRPRRERDSKHSGLGMASFLIAVVVGGLDIVLGLIVVLNVAGSKGEPEVRGSVLGGAMALVCLNCLSIPACLTGVGLAIAAFVAHKDRNHLLTYIGLAVNAVVVLAVLGLYAFASMSKGGPQ